MKYCPICERSYGDEAEVCEVDGAALRVSGLRQDTLVGKIIKGRYRVLKKLGEGGMGTVYLAEQVAISRKVALKLLNPDYARDQEFVRRFRQEAKLAASLNHRNVITVFDFDQADDGSLYIVMEYADGKSLGEVIREGPMDVARALRLGLQIAEGLGAAHRTGVIHRDIKPENIMVVGEGEEVKLMDFGIARLRDTGTATRMTRSGTIMGTPAYMAPEQIEGGEVSESTDIYAFGIVLYEMLSGEVPFKAPTPSAVLIKHLQEVAVPLRKVRKEVPPSVERVVIKALEKSPERRQKNMEEIVEWLKKAEWLSEQKKEPRIAQVMLPLVTVRRRVVEMGALLGKLLRGVAFMLRRAVTKIWERKPSRQQENLESAVQTADTSAEELERKRTPSTLQETRPIGVAKERSAVRGMRNFLGLASTVRGLGEAVSSSAGRVVRKALEINPRKRQRDIREVVQKSESTERALEREMLPGTLIATRSLEIQTGVKALKWGRKLVGVGSLVGILVMVGVLGGVYVYRKSVESKPQGLPVEDKKPPAASLPEVKIVSLLVRADKQELSPYERADLKVTGEYSDGKAEEITEGVEWRSSDTAVALVSSRGEVEAYKAGKAEIVARYKGLVAPPVTVTVKVPPQPVVPEARLVSLMVDAEKKELSVKESVGLTVKGRYSDGREKRIDEGVKWESSDATVALVNSKGKVEGRKEGRAQIVAWYRGVVASPVVVTVKVPPPLPVVPEVRLVSLAVQGDKKELNVQERAVLTVKGKYSDGKEEGISGGIKWESSDTTVALVKSRGEVEGRKAGRAEIVARYKELVAPSVTVTVKVPPPLPVVPEVRLVSLAVQADKKELNVKERAVLTVKGRYSDGKEEEISGGIKWESSDTTVALVNSRGEVEGRSEGRVEITAQYKGVTSPRLIFNVKNKTEIPQAEKAEQEKIQDLRRRLLR